MVEIHEELIDTSMVYSRYYVCDANLNTQSISKHQREISTSFLEEQNGAISHFVTFKKNLYVQSGGIEPTVLRAVDHELYFRLEEVGKTKFIDLPLYFYRTETGHNISLGSNSLSALLWDYIVVSDACRRRGISVEKHAFPLIHECIQWEVEAAKLLEANKIRSSRTYRLGKFMLSPFKYFKSLISK